MSTGLAFEMGNPSNITDDAEGFPYVVYYRPPGQRGWIPHQTNKCGPSPIHCARRAWRIALNLVATHGGQARIEEAVRGEE